MRRAIVLVVLLATVVVVDTISTDDAAQPPPAATSGSNAESSGEGTDAPTSTGVPSLPERSTLDTAAATTTPATTTPTTTVPEPVWTAANPRVLIDTDLGGGIGDDGAVRGDPDDIQSLVRAIHYSDALDIEGIVSTEGPGTARPELIQEWIRRTDVDHLRSLGYVELMSEADLLAAVKTGTRDRNGPADGRSTEGSLHIIERAHAGSEIDPLWILAWGSLGTVAQALHDDPTIVPKIRLYSIGDYNTQSNSVARDFVRATLDEHPDLWWVENGVLPVESRSTFAGVWQGGNQRGEWNRVTFLERHIRGHGTTADGAFPEKLGDAFPPAIGPPEAVGALKEGDSTSLLYLLSPRFGAVGDLDDPMRPSWGGRFRRAAPQQFPNYYIDLNCGVPEQCQATVNRHRVHFLGHWRDRWDRYDTAAG